MKIKLLTLSLAAGLIMSAAPLLADTTIPSITCTPPADKTDMTAVYNYESCLDEYIKTQHNAIDMHSKAARQAMEHKGQMKIEVGGN